MKKFLNTVTGMTMMLIAVFFVNCARADELLTWDACRMEAAGHHPDLISASETIKQAEAQRNIVRGGLLPSLSGSAGTDRSGGTNLTTSGNWSYSVNASQLIFDGSKTFNQVNAASETIKATRYSGDAVSAATRFALRSAFVQLLKAQELIKLTEEIAVIRRQNFRLIDLRYKSGREHKGSLSKAYADQQEAEFEVTQAKRNLNLAQVRLSTQLGRESFSPIRVSGRFAVSEKVTVLPDFERLVKEHPSYNELVSKKEANRYSLDAARSSFMPQVSLTTGVGNTAASISQSDNVDWQVGVNVAIPLYGGGTGRATVARARAAYNQLNADEKSGYFSLMRSLQESWKAFKDSADNVVIQRNYLDAANERARIANAQYSAGLVAFNEWIIIEDNLVSSKKSFLNAQADLLIAEAQWIQAKGGTFEIR